MLLFWSVREANSYNVHDYLFLCFQVEEKIKLTHRKYLLQEQLKIIKKVGERSG